MPHNLFDSLQTFSTPSGKSGQFYSLPALEKHGFNVSRLPVSIRVVLESVLRNCDGLKIAEDDIKTLASWKPNAPRTEEIPFVVARIVLQDFTGVPLLVDLAAMRSAAARAGKNPDIIEPLVPVDLIVDHSVQVDFSNLPNALQLNMDMEFKRNASRYQFLKWGMGAFETFSVVPPGIGIIHQVNLEFLAKLVIEKDGVWYPDTLVGTDSHTTMINGLGVVGWGVGGIEAEAGMLGQPVYFLTPDVVGVHLSGSLKEGVTATDLVLRITEMLRSAKVVGKFVEFYGEGAVSLTLPDRATIANMAPEYGATMGFFPVDDETLNYMKQTGRSAELIETVRAYYQAQGMFGIPKRGDVDYSQELELDLGEVVPAVAGPKRPQDRIDLPDLKGKFSDLFQAPVAQSGYNKTLEQMGERFPLELGHDSEAPVIEGGGEQSMDTVPVSTDLSGLETSKDTAAVTELEMVSNRPTPDRVAMDELSPLQQRIEFPKKNADLGHGDVVIAAITSCTNTSNPSVMLAAGLLAKKAVARGLKVKSTVKTSLAPGSRVVTDYLNKTGLQHYLDELGFFTVGYGCTTCIGNSGPLDSHIERAVVDNDLVVASVLSGNRNFEARVHQSVKANFLMSPPLVVAFALAGTVEWNPYSDAIGQDSDGKDVFLADIWPSGAEVADAMGAAFDDESYTRSYAGFDTKNPMWNAVEAPSGAIYEWDESSTYIQEPPFFEKFAPNAGTSSDIKKARPLGIFGDSVTTDHISPAGAIKPSSPAGKYLQTHGVEIQDFNSYGSRRGNDRVMTRGTFANVRIKNLMVPGVEGGVTIMQPSGEQMSIFDASTQYQAAKIPLVIFAGQEYGTGSSRDWAAKGTSLLGVKAVVASSYERIHRSNLVGMGVLPLQFKEGQNARTLELDGTETFDFVGLSDLKPQSDVSMIVYRTDGSSEQVTLTLRIDTPIEVEYFLHGGILPYVLRQLMA